MGLERFLHPGGAPRPHASTCEDMPSRSGPYWAHRQHSGNAGFTRDAEGMVAGGLRAGRAGDRGLGKSGRAAWRRRQA